MSNITNMLNILGLSATEYATICSTLQYSKMEYPLKTLKKVMVILNSIMQCVTNTNFKQYNNEIILYLILAKNNQKNDILFKIKPIQNITSALYNNTSYQNKNFITLILSLHENDKYCNLIRSISFIRNIFTKQERLDIFGKNITDEWLHDIHDHNDKRKEWLPYFLTNYVHKNCIHYIYTYDKDRNYELYLQIEKFQNNKDKIYLICNPLVNDTLIENILGKTRIELINEMDLLNVVFNYDNLRYIKTLDISKASDQLYLKIVDELIWKTEKRYSTELFIIAFQRQFYTIIIDHLNKNIPIDNINKYISILFTNKNYKNIEQVLKNCGTYDMLEILDHLNSRKLFDTTFCEFCINYIPRENININLLKKFFRLNTYIKDLDRFLIPYDENLYKLCYNYDIYPDEYMNKLKDIKLDATLKSELISGRNKYCPMSIYTLLKGQLFKGSLIVLPIDDIILDHINNYLGI